MTIFFQIRLRPSRRIVMTLDHDGRVKLTVGSVNRRDAGVYKCVATNEVGRTEISIRVNVQSKEGAIVEEIVKEEPALKKIPEKAIP